MPPSGSTYGWDVFEKERGVIPTGHFAFGNGGETTLSVPALAALATGVATMCYLPKRQIWIPFVVTAIMLPATQDVVLFGLHFPIPRIAVVCAWIILLIGGKPFERLRGNGFGVIDKLFIGWVVTGTIAYTLLYHALGALVYRLGFAVSALGGYFLLRQAICDRGSMLRLIRLLAVLALVIGVLMLFELRTGQNLLAFMGAAATDEVREGRIRAQGPFVHSIVAGTAGAILFPLFCGSIWVKSLRKYAVAGIVGSAAIIVASASSTPIGGCLGGIAALCLWPLRRHMRMIRWAIVASLVGLQLVMKGPVWALLLHFDATGSSSSWHRYMLVDECIRHFGDWWLIGTNQNASWGYDMWDRANWYVENAYTGGLSTLVCFVAMIVVAFKSIGIARRRCAGDNAAERLVWAMGAALVAATVCFIGIYLSDQSIIIWFALLALINAARKGALRGEAPRSSTATAEQKEACLVSG